MGKFLGSLAIIGLGVLLYSQYKKLKKEQKAKLKETDRD
jgi:hypothetical protein